MASILSNASRVMTKLSFGGIRRSTLFQTRPPRTRAAHSLVYAPQSSWFPDQTTEPT